MASFDRPLGPSKELAIDGSSSEASTVPASDGELPTERESCTTTEPEEPSEVEVWSCSSSSDVEIVGIKQVPKLPLPEFEAKLMGEHERYGYLFRCQDRDTAWQRKLAEVRSSIANESPEAKRLRKATFRREVYGMHS